jgi:hypothetical protein
MSFNANLLERVARVSFFRPGGSRRVHKSGPALRLPFCFALMLATGALHAQQGQQPPAPAGPGQGAGRGGPGASPAAANARAQAPYDLTGYWVSMVTDDWRYRMLTPPKGNADYIPVNADARKVMDGWDPAKDEASGEACRGYGAGGIMRLPGRLHITWEDDNTMKMDLDTGTQTRKFVFGAAAPAVEPSWQGSSIARWMFPPGARGRGAERPQTGQLVVTTTRLRPGYLRKNGVPYSANATLTEYYVRLVDDGGQEYLAVTTMVDDPQYLAQPYIKTYEFKKQPDATGWNPTGCSAK